MVKIAMGILQHIDNNSVMNGRMIAAEMRGGGGCKLQACGPYKAIHLPFPSPPSYTVMPTTESSTPPPPSISQTTTPATPTMTNATGANNVESTSATTPLNMNSTPNDKTTHRDRVRLKGKFPSTMTPSGRQDVLALKQQLADALGENGPLYWDALKDFVAGKLNRQEFDFYANLYLSRENGKWIEERQVAFVLTRGLLAYLHNAFILSTIHNAQAAHPPPSKHRSVGWAKRKRGKDGSLLDGSQDRDPQKRRLKMDVMSLSKADRDRLKQLVKVKKRE